MIGAVIIAVGIAVIAILVHVRVRLVIAARVVVLDVPGQLDAGSHKAAIGQAQGFHLHSLTRMDAALKRSVIIDADRRAVDIPHT